MPLVNQAKEGKVNGVNTGSLEVTSEKMRGLQIKRDKEKEERVKESNCKYELRITREIRFMSVWIVKMSMGFTSDT